MRTRSTTMVAAVAALILPFGIMIVRVLSVTRHVYLDGDLATIDLHVRDAMRFHQALGPYDRYGWDHPGPAYFYLLSLPGWVLGSGARAEFAGVALLNGLSAGCTLWVVRRRAGPVAAVWCAFCLGLLGVILSVGAYAAPNGMVSSPWNPYVVIVPMLLFVVLCAAAVAGSPWSALGACVVGSFAVQTDFSTFPFVVVFLVAAGVVLAVRAHRDRADASSPSRGRRTGPAIGAALVVLVLMWVPPVIQQLTDSDGNISAIWHFFTAHHPTKTLGAGLWSTVAVDAIVNPFQHQGSVFQAIGTPGTGAPFVLAAVLAAGVAGIVLGVRRRTPFATALGIASLVGFAVTVASVTRVVGVTYEYLILFTVVFPLSALICIGTACLRASEPSTDAHPPHAPRTRLLWGAGVAVLYALVAVVAIAFSLRATHGPSLAVYSRRNVAQALAVVSTRLTPGSRPVEVRLAGANLLTFYGLFNELQAREHDAFLAPSWAWVVGRDHVSSATPKTIVTLYPRDPSAERLPGYTGHTAGVDFVVTKNSN